MELSHEEHSAQGQRQCDRSPCLLALWSGQSSGGEACTAPASPVGERDVKQTNRKDRNTVNIFS